MSWQQLAYNDAIGAGVSDPNLFVNLIGAESGGNPNAISSTGAIGYGQVLPSTAEDPGFGVAPFNPYDPNSNLQGSANYFAALQGQYGSQGALNFYNTGSASGQNSYPGSLNSEAAANDQGIVGTGVFALNPWSTALNKIASNPSNVHEGAGIISRAALRIFVAILAIGLIVLGTYAFIQRESMTEVVKGIAK